MKPHRYQGLVKSFSEDRRYGFILYDEDDKAVFFHESAVALDERGFIAHGARVTFEIVPTPKGYKAVKIRFVEASAPNRYLLGNETHLFNEKVPHEYTTLLDMPDVFVLGESRHGAKKAKEALKENLARLGFNAGHHVSFYTVTMSEPGTGRGTHYYTQTGFRCTPSVVGIRSTEGDVAQEDVVAADFDERIESAVARHNAKRLRLNALRWIGAVIWTVLLLVFGFIPHTDHGHKTLLFLLIGFVVGFAVLRIFLPDIGPISWIVTRKDRRFDEVANR